MRRHTMRVHRAVRRITLGSGPLKRGTDRLQALGRLGLLLILLAAVPAAVWAASATRGHLSAVAQEQARTRQHTEATLLRDAVAAPAPDNGAAPIATATARWAAPDGSLRVGVVPAPLGARAATTMSIWVDADGTLSSAPLDVRSISHEATAAGAGAATGVAVTGWGLYALLCWRLERRRDRQWTDGWAAVGPVWAAQRH